MGIHPGVKIVCNGREGTLGLLVKRNEEPDKTYLLTCWHILDDGVGSGEVKLPEQDDQVVARYQRAAITAREDMDVAIAEIIPGHGLPIGNQIADGSGTIAQAAYWDIGMDLTKYGAGTRRTQCRLLEDTDQFGNVKYGLKLGRHPDGEDIYCAHGDSGVVWCSKAGDAIGMHSKGGFAGNLAAAAPVKVILKEMGLTIL